MAESTGIVVATGLVTLANDALFAPLASGKPATASVNWRIVPAVAGLAVALDLLERIAPKFAIGLAWLAFATAMVVPIGNAPTPLENINKALGFAGKVTG